MEGDPLDPEVLRRATEGIDVAFYPLRFVGADAEFEERRRVFPGVPGRMHPRGRAEDHLPGALRQGCGRERAAKKMVDIGEVLSACPDRIRTVWFRAGLVLGSGSLLFEALRNLAQKLPVLPTPRWMEPGSS